MPAYIYQYSSVKATKTKKIAIGGKMSNYGKVHIIYTSQVSQEWFDEYLQFKNLVFALYPDNADYYLIVDYPNTFNQSLLVSIPLERTILIANNLCPEYLENQWDKSLGGLLVAPCTWQHIETALETLSRGERYRNFDPIESCLTPTQRRCLDLIRSHLDTPTEATLMGTTEARVRNMWSAIYERLGLKNRCQLFAYYTGLWHTLEGTPYFDVWLGSARLK